MLNKLKLAVKVANRISQAGKNLFLLKRGKNLKPKWIWFGVTDNCNSRCTHCHIWQKKPTVGELTLAELEKVFSDPLLSEVETIINSGGEAILRQDIVEVIKLENRMFPKAALDLSTNGILADRALEVVQAVLDANIKINVGVSLDGIGETHDKIRGVPGNFKKVDYLLTRLAELKKKYPDKLSFVVGFTLSDITLGHWREVREYVGKFDAEFMMQWYNQSAFYENAPRDNQTNRHKAIEAVKSQPRTIIREKWLKLLNGKPIKFRCFAAQSFFALRCDGGIVPCLNYWDDVIGNVRKNSPSEIWQSDQAVKIREKVSKCPGCLNSWGVEWSISTSFYPRILFYLRNPKAILDRLRRIE